MPRPSTATLPSKNVRPADRKSTRLNSSHSQISYAVFCLKKKHLRYMLDPVDRVEVVDRYTVRFRLKEPFVWLPNMLANPLSTWIVAREVVEKYGDLKKAE